MQTDTLTPADRARLLCIVGECPGVDGGCCDTPPRCARYGGDANEVYVSAIERGLSPTVRRGAIDWLSVATWASITVVYGLLAYAVGWIVCARFGW